MSPQWILGGIAICVTLGTFFLGRWSRRWMDQGAADAKAEALKEIADKLDTKVGVLSEGAARREEQIKGLVAQCDALGDEIAAHGLRLGYQENSMASLRGHLGFEDSGRHFAGTEPGRDSGGVVR